MDKKIFITGPSGIGKTTLAKYISGVYNIPYISTSASKLWGEFNFKSHVEAHTKSILDPKLGLAYQEAIMRDRAISLKGNSWVTDRSPIDNIAYMLLTLSHQLSVHETIVFIREALKMLGGCSGIIHLQSCEQPSIENNGKRILNPFYQLMVDSIIAMVIENTCFQVKILKIKTWDLEERKKLVKNWIECGKYE